MFQSLNELCQDEDVTKVISKIQHHLEILEPSVARVSSRAEVFGAVQQVIYTLCLCVFVCLSVYVSVCVCLCVFVSRCLYVSSRAEVFGAVQQVIFTSVIMSVFVCLSVCLCLCSR